MKMVGGQLKRPGPPMAGEHSVIQHTPTLHPPSRPSPDQDCSSSPKRKKRTDQVTLVTLEQRTVPQHDAFQRRSCLLSLEISQVHRWCHDQ